MGASVCHHDARRNMIGLSSLAHTWCAFVVCPRCEGEECGAANGAMSLSFWIPSLSLALALLISSDSHSPLPLSTLPRS